MVPEEAAGAHVVIDVLDERPADPLVFRPMSLGGDVECL